MPGDTTFLAGEQIDRSSSTRRTHKAEARSCRPARPRRCCRASPRRACRRTRSSRRPRSRKRPACLPRPPSSGKVDTLEGLKENVIVGRLIPAGTGGAIARLREIAARDREMEAGRRPEQPRRRRSRPRRRRPEIAKPKGCPGEGPGDRPLPLFCRLYMAKRRSRSYMSKAAQNCGVSPAKLLDGLGSATLLCAHF